MQQLRSKWNPKKHVIKGNSKHVKQTEPKKVAMKWDTFYPLIKENFQPLMELAPSYSEPWKIRQSRIHAFLSLLTRVSGTDREAVCVNSTSKGSSISVVFSSSSSSPFSAVQQVEVGEQLDVGFLLLELGVEPRVGLEFFEDGVAQRIEDVLGDDGQSRVQTFLQRRHRRVTIRQIDAGHGLSNQRTNDI